MVGNLVRVVIDLKMVTEMTTSGAVGTSMVAITLEKMEEVSSQAKLGDVVLSEMEILTRKLIKTGDKELLLYMMKVKVKV